MQLTSAILRGFQAIFAATVLGISIQLARGQATALEPVPAATGYAAFCGALGLLVSLVGITSLFVSSLEGVITWALDALAGLAMLAGGIAYAVLLRNTSCDAASAQYNSLLNGGCIKVGKVRNCRYVAEENPEEVEGRCASAKADNAFMFISFVVCFALIVYSFIVRRRGGGKGFSYA